MTREEMTVRMRGWAIKRAATMLPPDDVEDAAQVAAFACWQASARLRPGADPWPLLTVVARQALAAHARRYWERRAVPIERADTATRHDTTETTALDRLDGDAVRAALDTLTDRERTVVVAIDMHDQAPEDVARALGLSPKAGAVRQARRRAHTKLRIALSAQLSEETPA